MVSAEPLPPLVALWHQLPETADVGGGGHGEVHEVGLGRAVGFPEGQRKRGKEPAGL